MRIYKYSPAGSLVSETEMPDAMAADVLATEANTTADEPPERTNTHAPLWVDGVWTLAPDLRGSGWHDPATGEEIIIREVGQQPPAGWVEGEAPLPVESLESAKARKNTAITQRRVSEDMRFPHGGKWFQADLAAWKQISGIHGWVSAMNSLPPGFPGQWKAEDNTHLAISDVAAWWQFYGAVLARGSANFMHSEALKAQLSAATTVAEVEAVPVW